MKRVLAVLLCLLMLSMGVTVSAASTAKDIPVTTEEEFPAAVEELLLSKAFITAGERLNLKTVKEVIGLEEIIAECADDLQNSEDSLVVVPREIVLKNPILKSRARVECSQEFVYTTYYSQNIKYEWIYYLDGRVQKTVSYDYEERTSEFKKYTYTIVNDNNEGLKKSRLEIAEKDYSLHVGDFLFGMAIAVVLMMIGVLIVRAIKKA